ncbi:hypothetical protein [Labilithrix luteola]|uniref:hypothetical protein n=1 Tax=Labilithrix luteola TaxID=1391654 RepID=UPI0011BA5FC5|nr:hypothetical protein [Labilithrix luteola]
MHHADLLAVDASTSPSDASSKFVQEALGDFGAAAVSTRQTLPEPHPSDMHENPLGHVVCSSHVVEP